MESVRSEALGRIRERMLASSGIVLTTHVNADGDGAACEGALARWLIERGRRVWIANPTPFPDAYRFLVPEEAQILDVRESDLEEVRSAVDLMVVLDTAEPKRVERALRAFPGLPILVIDHHPASEPGIEAEIAVQDTTACATGELIFDMLTGADDGRPWAFETVYGIYTAIVFDTGSFRFANTTPRAHGIAAELIRRGLDPERAYRHLFGSVPVRRLRVLQAALASLDVDPEFPIASITLSKKEMDALGATSDDMEGIVEHARSIEGTEVALLFREVNGSTKISLRSNGPIDVNAIARQFGGGGHVKASGALVAGRAAAARKQVIEATRAALREHARTYNP